MKKATLQIVLIMLFAPFILAQTTHRYLENFDSGIAEGWAFYTDASVSVQNGQLRIQSTSPDFQIAHIYPPIGATINDFSIEFSNGTNPVAEGGFVGRLGFNSLLGMLFEDDTMRVVYATNITNFMQPDFITLHTLQTNDYTTRGKIQVTRSGNDLLVNCWLNDTLRFNGGVMDAEASLLKGHLMFSVVGDSLDFTLAKADFNYVPYISDQSTSYYESFNDPNTPWYKYGSWDQVGQAITISNGNLNINYTGTDFVSLYVGTPVGSVENYELSATLGGPTASGNFGIWRLYSLRYYTGMYFDGDTLFICYQDGGVGEPLLISKIGIDLNQFSQVRLRCERNGTNLAFAAYGNSTQILTGTLTTSDARLYAGHLLTGFDTDQNLAMSFTESSIAFNRYVTNVVEVDPVVSSFALGQNYPNPFNPETKVEYTLEKPGWVKLVVFDALGRECVTLVDEMKSDGNYSVTFDATGLPSGVYLYRLSTDGFTRTKKMVLLR
ncbi:MAG: hypothetical protein HBSAPP04_24490 [Ignavibacteriaceae bacterium]|nr:MAG: hypothetical protein HBSAPP04_24490 [Ignavibacteriaceae bacterium]